MVITSYDYILVEVEKNNKRRSSQTQNLSGLSKFMDWGFLGGSVVKNPRTNAGDMGSIPSLSVATVELVL